MTRELLVPIESDLVASARAVRRNRPPSLHRLAEKAILSRLEVLLKNEQPMRQAGDVEALHDMRVASRRLREALRVYGRLFSAKRVRQALRDAGQITRALGVVREVDVNLDQLSMWQKSATEQYQSGLEFLTAIELERQARMRRRMLKRIEKVDLSALRAELVKLLKRPSRLLPDKDSSTLPSFEDFARPLIEESLRPVCLALERVSAHPTPRNYHLFRIRVKKLRYTVELLARAFEWHRGTRIRENLKLLQDALGILHDRVVLHTRAREIRRALRAHELHHLDKDVLRVMRFLAHHVVEQRREAERNLLRLERRRFFENIPAALKENP